MAKTFTDEDGVEWELSGDTEDLAQTKDYIRLIIRPLIKKQEWQVSFLGPAIIEVDLKGADEEAVFAVHSAIKALMEYINAPDSKALHDAGDEAERKMRVAIEEARQRIQE